MWVRRAFFSWMVPAAFVLPLWLLVGWGVFDGGGWAFLWVLFVAIPSVFVGQLALTLLVRARGTVRAERAVSWWDVLGFGVWHGLTIALGFYQPTWWAALFAVTIAVGLGLFWSSLWQLLREARPGRILITTSQGIGYIPPPRPAPAPAERDVIVVTERSPRDG